MKKRANSLPSANFRRRLTSGLPFPLPSQPQLVQKSVLCRCIKKKENVRGSCSGKKGDEGRIQKQRKSEDKQVQKTRCEG